LTRFEGIATSLGFLPFLDTHFWSVRNIDPIWGDCDDPLMLQRIPQDFANWVRNFDPI